MPAPRRPWLPDIDTTRCTGCGWCVAACPLHLLTLEVSNGRKASTLHDAPACTGCRQCEWRCPFGVITMRPVGVSDPAAHRPPDPRITG